MVLATALSSSSAQAGVPAGSAAVTFAWGVLKGSLVPAAFGGPWRWWPLPGQATALALPPHALTWLAMGLAVVVVLGSIARRPVAWRAWAALALWVAFADMLPVMIGKLNWYPVLLALNTRYVADARPVLALCLALAFLPVRPALQAQGEASGAASGEPATARTASASRRPSPGARVWRPVAAALLAIFLVGSVWSARTYQSKVTGAPAAGYIATATAAVELARPGTPVRASDLPGQLASAGSDTRTVLGAIRPGKLRWLDRPDGTVDGVRMFGPDGRLFPLWVYGASSGRGPYRGCWPGRHGTVTIPFLKAPTVLTTMLRIGYLWAAGAGQLQVSYGTTVRTLPVRHGLHTAYLPVKGSAGAIGVTGFGSGQLCIGDVEASRPGPLISAPSLPSEPQS